MARIPHAVDLRYSQADFRKVFIGSSDVNTVQHYLESSLKNILISRTTLLPLNQVTSPGGEHLLFQQSYRSIPIYRAQVKANMDKKGYLISLFDNSYVFDHELPSNFPSVETVESVIGVLGGRATMEFVQTEANYFNDGNQWMAVSRIEVTRKNMEHIEVLTDASGTIVYQRDMNTYFKSNTPKDSMVNAMVFFPDPLTKAQVNYGAPYRDYNDSDLVLLNAERLKVPILTTFMNDTFRLENSYVTIKDFSSPIVAPAYATVDTGFFFTRKENGFEDVNTYYHISIFQQHIRNLGFSNLGNYSIWIDTHALNGQDNSMFSNSYTPPRLLFGEGNVDDAEDADVVIHEYGHAISFGAAPNTNTGSQRTALDEANGDYFASSYSRFLNSYKWEAVFSWDGHNEFWNGRNTVSIKHYPENLNNDLYADAEIWSATMMQLYEDLGRNVVDKILLQSMYGYASGMKMNQAATLLIQADSLLNNGANYNVICNRLYNRGLTSLCTVGVADFTEQREHILLQNSSQFSEGKNCTVHFSIPTTAFISVTDVQGKVVFTQEITNGIAGDINGNLFSKGMYLLRVSTPSQSITFKLIRF